MAVTIKRDGYSQVEPNHLSAPRTGQVFAQLPAKEGIDKLEQGMFVHYDYAAGNVNFDGEGPWMMVYNEEKLYDERHQMHKDYAQTTEDAYNGVITPRVFQMQIGDLYTTNAVAEGEYTVGDELKIGPDGFPVKGDAAVGDPCLKVVKETVMPDMQPAVKLQVIA